MNRTILAAFLITSNALADNAEAPSGLCASNETSFFACSTSKQRWISLCGASEDALQYRFGRLNRIELSYPENAAEGKDKFLFARYFRYQTERLEVGFRNKGVEYAIFDYTEDKQRTAGVRVTFADGRETEIPCTGQISSRLGELKTVLRCDADNALNGGICPE